MQADAIYIFAAPVIRARVNGESVFSLQSQHTLIRPSGTFSRKREKGV